MNENKDMEWISRLDILERYLNSIQQIIRFEDLPEKNIEMLRQGIQPLQEEYDKIVKEQNLGVCIGCGHQFVMDFEGDDECGWCEETYKERSVS